MTLSSGTFERRAVPLDFPPVGRSAALLPEPAVRPVSKEGKFPTCPASEPARALRLRAPAGSFPADTSSHPRRGVSLVVAVVASAPARAVFTKSGPRLNWLCQRVGDLITLKRAFAWYVIKTVPLCHHPTQVLIMLLDVPVGFKCYFWIKLICHTQTPKGTVTLTMTLSGKINIVNGFCFFFISYKNCFLFS